MRRGERREPETRRVKGRQKKARQPNVGLYREGQLGKGIPAPELEKFRIGGMVCQPHPVTGKKGLRHSGTTWHPGLI